MSGQWVCMCGQGYPCDHDPPADRGAAPAGPEREADLTDTQLDEFEMELDLASFAKTLPPDVQFRESHRIAFRAGWTARAHAGERPAEAPSEAIEDALSTFERAVRENAFCSVEGGIPALVAANNLDAARKAFLAALRSGAAAPAREGE